jgi:hypothetical protein
VRKYVKKLENSEKSWKISQQVDLQVPLLMLMFDDGA